MLYKRYIDDSDRQTDRQTNIPQLYTHLSFHLPTEFNTLVNLIGVLYICIMAKRKKKTINLQNHTESLKAFKWCVERNIRIYPIPSATQYQIVIDNGVSKVISPKLYDKNEWSDKIWELYRHFYNKSKVSV
jgi:virulence-associated protein VapD